MTVLIGRNHFITGYGTMTYAEAIRQGREVPHRRHWPVLLELAQKRREWAEVEERFADVDVEEEILLGLHDFSLSELADRTGLLAGCLGEVRHGEKGTSREEIGEYVSPDVVAVAGEFVQVIPGPE